MGKGRMIGLLALLAVLALSACSSDDGESSFRNLGKRGDSDLTAQRADAALR